MKNHNQIGLDQEKAKLLINALNNLLADYQIFYMNTRGLHWNIKGEQFFELHIKYEELYSNLVIKIDEIAERVVTLEGVPLHSFTDYINASSIKAVKNVTNGKEGVQLIVDSLQKVILKQRDLLKLSEEADDEGTNALMSDYVREQEKLTWMYSSYLNK